MCFANLIQPAWKLSSFDKDVLEHTELRVHHMNRVYNGCQTTKPTTYRATHDFPWFSVVFKGFPDDGIAVSLGPLWFLPS